MIRAVLIAIAALTSAALTSAARAQTPTAAPEIAIALTDERVAVDTGFAGARLTLFGAVTAIEDLSTIDIISVISGPASRFKVRQMEKRRFIWAPGPAHYIDGAPGLHLTYSTRPIDDIAPLPEQADRQLRPGYLDFIVRHHDGNDAAEDAAPIYRAAFLEESERIGLYRAQTSSVSFRKGALFTINARLPANTPVGSYDVAVYLFRNGELLASDTAKLAVNRVGLERRIYDFAHEQSVVYGLFCVLLSLISGWFAAFAFRK